MLEESPVHLWWTEVPSSLSELHERALWRFVSADERMRASRFVHDADRYQFLIARHMLRSVLADLLDQAPSSFDFSFNPRGRPELDNRPLGFSISHCRGLVVVAIHERSKSIGVDAEPIARAGQVQAVAESVFSRAELDYLSTQPLAAQVHAWTLKEAYIKARGMGLALPLSEISILSGPGPLQLCCPPHIDDEPEAWVFACPQLVEGFDIAVAYKSVMGDAAITTHAWQAFT